MKRQSFQTKRHSTNGGLFVFHTKTRRRRKQRVAAGASADLGSEVPNLGVARALFVILILHVAAIAAIFIHNRVTEEDPAVMASDVPATPAGMGTPPREKLPVIRKGEDFYFVATGDTYDRIARLKGVDVNELRDLNENVRLKAGRILRVPAVGANAPSERSAALARNESAETPAPASTPPRAAAPPDAEELPSVRPIMVHRSEPAPAVRVVVEEPESAPSAQATKVTPRVRPGSDPPVPAAVPVASGQTYTVKRGDTAWGIAKRHKVSADNLLKENGISDPRKMWVGMKLRIPAN